MIGIASSHLDDVRQGDRVVGTALATIFSLDWHGRIDEGGKAKWLQLLPSPRAVVPSAEDERQMNKRWVVVCTGDTYGNSGMPANTALRCQRSEAAWLSWAAGDGIAEINS